MKLRHPLQYYWLLARVWIRKLFMLRTDPNQIALGFAIGAFIGVFPTFGVGFLLISAVALIIKFNVIILKLNMTVIQHWLMVLMIVQHQEHIGYTHDLTSPVRGRNMVQK